MCSLSSVKTNSTSTPVPSEFFIPILRPLTLPFPLDTTFPVHLMYLFLYFFHSLSFCDSVILFFLPKSASSSSKGIFINPSTVSISMSSFFVTIGAIDPSNIISGAFITSASVVSSVSESDCTDTAAIFSISETSLSPIFFISTLSILHRRFLPNSSVSLPV